MVSEQESLGFLLADLSRMMRQAFQRRLEGSSITLAQARALVYLARHQGIRQMFDVIEFARMMVGSNVAEVQKTTSDASGPNDRFAGQTMQLGGDFAEARLRKALVDPTTEHVDRVDDLLRLKRAIAGLSDRFLHFKGLPFPGTNLWMDGGAAI